MLNLLADFNDVRHGSVSGLKRYLTGVGSPRAGTPVLVSDGEGEFCFGTIERIEGELVYVTLDLGTWYHQEPEEAIRRVVTLTVLGIDLVEADLTEGIKPDLGLLVAG